MIEIDQLKDDIYDLISPLIQNKSVQTFTFSEELVTENKINGKIDGVEITEILFDTDTATTLNLLAAEILTFPGVESVSVNSLVVTVTCIQSHKYTFTDFLITEGAVQPLITIEETRTEIHLIFRDQANPQPVPPYVTIKIISGPIQIGHDELKNTVGTGKFKSQGIREATISCQAFGEKSFEILSRLQDNISIPEIMDKFHAKKISVYNATSITDLTALVETVFESRHSMDLFIYIGTETATSETFIESTGINGELEKPDGNDFIIPEFVINS